MLEFGNRSRSLRRRRLAEQRQSSSTTRSSSKRSVSGHSSRRSPNERKRQMYAKPAHERLRLVPRPTAHSPQSSAEPATVRRSPASAFTARLGSMGTVADSAPASARSMADPARSPASSNTATPSSKPSRPVAPSRSRPASKTAPPRRAAQTGRSGSSDTHAEATPRRKPWKSSSFLYAVRTLILVVGVGAIAGTLLSTLNPSGQIADASQQSIDPPASELSDSASSSPGLGLANVFSAYNGRELSRLSQDILDMRELYTDLTPGVFMLDLDTGNTVDINGATTFAAASMIKVPVLVAFFQDVDAGRIQLDEMLTMEEEDVASGSGDMQFDSIGTEYTALETATLMIIISDNTATNMLIRRMGGIDAMNQRFRSWGLRETAIRNVLPDLDGTNTTTPKELVGLMTMVSKGDLISLRSRDRMLDIMRRTYTDTLIPAGVGDPEATIAHKTGDIGELVGDVGLVDMPNGKRYAITTLMKRPFNDDRAQEWIRHINDMVYREMQENQTPSLFDGAADSPADQDQDTESEYSDSDE